MNEVESSTVGTENGSSTVEVEVTTSKQFSAGL